MFEKRHVWRSWTLTWTMCALLLFPGIYRAQSPAEYQLKAAHLMNFPKFIEWPSTIFEFPGSPIVICILGDDPFGRDLDQLVAGESVNGRKITVQRIQRAPAPKSCQVLFFGKKVRDVPAILSNLGPGVLTVSDRDGFLAEGGMIALVIEDQHVRFDVNQAAAVKASVIINAKMLKVARSVVR